MPFKSESHAKSMSGSNLEGGDLHGRAGAAQTWGFRVMYERNPREIRWRGTKRVENMRTLQHTPGCSSGGSRTGVERIWREDAMVGR